MKEKAIPLAVTKALLELEGLVKDVDLRIVNVIDDNLMNLECGFADKTFFFKIRSHTTDNSNRVIYHFVYMPSTEETFVPNESRAAIKTVAENLKQWLILVKSYHVIDKPFKDKILKYYEDQLHKEHELIDPDADVVPYHRDIQLKIYGALDQVILALEAKKSIDQEGKFEELIEESKSLQLNMQTMVKRKVFDKFIGILAKMWRYGGPVVTNLISNTIYDVLKRVLLGGG